VTIILDIDEEPQHWLIGQQPFLRSPRDRHPASRFTPGDRTDQSVQQEGFENLLRYLSSISPDGRVPVYTRWKGELLRLDLKRVRHALQRGVIDPPQDNDDLGYVTHISLRGNER
jgi:hypothetical protein